METIAAVVAAVAAASIFGCASIVWKRRAKAGNSREDAGANRNGLCDIMRVAERDPLGWEPYLQATRSARKRGATEVAFTLGGESFTLELGDSIQSEETRSAPP